MSKYEIVMFTLLSLTLTIMMAITFIVVPCVMSGICLVGMIIYDILSCIAVINSLKNK